MSAPDVTEVLASLVAERDRLTVAIDVRTSRVSLSLPLVYVGAPPETAGCELPSAAQKKLPRQPAKAPAVGSNDRPPLLRDRIVAALHGLPSASWDEVIDACQPTTPDSLKIALRDATNIGLVERVGKGQYALPVRVVDGAA